MYGLKIGASLILAGLLSACATTGDTPRAAPDRSLSINAPVAKTKTAVASLFTQKGFVIKQDTDFVLTFEHPSSDFAANFLLGSTYAPGVDNRVIVQFVGDNPTTVSWHSYIVTNPGSGYEQLTETTGSANNDVVEQAFDGIKAQLESKPGKVSPVKAAAVSPAPVAASSSRPTTGGF